MDELLINATQEIGKLDGPCLISIIVPVFNTEAYLAVTLDSIAVYGGRNVEIIIVDDGSTDDSAQVIDAWIQTHDVPVRVLRQENAGLSAARMAGLALATGTFVGFCDSDDRLDIAVYVAMARLALQRDCDMAICRSVVFDSVSEESHDFYDAAVWHDILSASRCLMLNGLSEPRLFRLEPNANTRLLRREFMLQHGLTFPTGLHFEDFPVHVHALSVARNVLLMNATGYFYRVNRIGKITDQKSAKRFDILNSVTLAFNHAQEVDERGLAQITAMACRMIYWCGTHTLNKDRARFYSDACTLLSRLVPTSIWPLAEAAALDERERLIMTALAARAKGLLVDTAARRRPRKLKNALVLLCHPHFGRTARQVVLRTLKWHLRNYIRRLARLGRP